MSLRRVVVVAYHVFSLVVRLFDGTRFVVEQRKPFFPFYHKLEVYLLAMALRIALFQRLVLAVFNAGNECRTCYRVLTFGNSEQVSLLQPLEQRIPLCLVLIILVCKLLQIYRLVGLRLRKSVAPLSPYLAHCL